MTKYVSAWEAYTTPIGVTLEAALDAGEIEANDIVWRGPSGDYVVAATSADLDEEYAEYTDSGLVSEYVHES